MDTKNLSDSVYGSDHTERLDQFTNVPVATPDPAAGEVPVVATPIQDTPVSVNSFEANTLNESLVPVPEAKVDQVTPYPAPPSFDEEMPASAPVSDKTLHEDVPVVPKGATPAALLEPDASEHLRTRWNEIQGKFVDEPRDAVQQADVLVTEVVEKITQMFAD